MPRTTTDPNVRDPKHDTPVKASPVFTEREAQAEARRYATRAVKRLARKGTDPSWIGAYMLRYRQITGRPLVAGPVTARRRRRAA